MSVSPAALWKFARPHTIYGTAVSLIGLYLIASGPFTPAGAGALLLAEASCLCANVYIVGLNQLTDVEIDRINKPYLPLASGEMSTTSAIVLIVGLLAVGLALAVVGGPFLTATVGVSALIGTAYSLPPLRLKRFPLFASLCIFTVRGLVVNLGIYWYFRHLANQPVGLDPGVTGLALFVTVFTFVIALFKDIPDMEGDRRFNISTFSLRLGRRYVFDLCCTLLVANYLLSPLITATAGSLGRAPLMAVAHLLLAAFFWWQSRRIDLKNDAEVYDFYQFIWKLYYIEYLVYPLFWLS